MQFSEIVTKVHSEAISTRPPSLPQPFPSHPGLSPPLQLLQGQEEQEGGSCILALLLTAL